MELKGPVAKETPLSDKVEGAIMEALYCFEASHKGEITRQSLSAVDGACYRELLKARDLIRQLRQKEHAKNG
jgi:hypothetical protein